MRRWAERRGAGPLVAPWPGGDHLQKPSGRGSGRGLPACGRARARCPCSPLGMVLSCFCFAFSWTQRGTVKCNR